jgi:succinate---hydroxymethylglutarate CoA-transferase
MYTLITANHTRSEVEALAKKHDLAFGSINTLDESLEEAQVKHNKTIVPQHVDNVGKYRTARPPAVFSNTKTGIRSPPPFPGQHTKEVLGGL